MKTKGLIFVLAIILMAACGGDKQSELNQLIKQRDGLNKKIADLQIELANDSSIVKELEGKLVGFKSLEPSTFRHFIEVQGKLDGDENVAVYAEAMGNIKAVYVKAGEKVNKGQVLAQINDDAVREQLKSLETNMDFVTELYNKQKNLWDQKIGSEVQYLDAKNRKESLESQISSLKKQLDMMKIKAPINGTVEDVTLKVGQMAVPQFPAFRMVNFSELKITAEVSESYSAKVHKGDLVLVYLPDIETDIKAQVDFCSKYINPINRTFLVEAHFASQHTGLKANMVAVMKINDYTAQEAIVLPINYVKTDQQGSYVMLAIEKEGKYLVSKKYFVPGISYNGMIEVKSGLEKGQKLITAGFLNVEDGEIVRF